MILIFPMIFPMFPHGFPVCSPFFPAEIWRFLGPHLNFQVALPSLGLSAAPWNIHRKTWEKTVTNHGIWRIFMHFLNSPTCQTGQWPKNFSIPQDLVKSCHRAGAHTCGLWQRFFSRIKDGRT